MEQQTAVLTKKYLHLPISQAAPWQTVSIAAQGREPYVFKARLDPAAPSLRMYIDVSAFAGKTVEISPVFPLETADEMQIPGLYHEPLRPKVHFSSRQGWLNDPNGLIKIDETYHLFYQHNPADFVWQNMHWGHAVSHDLLHWEERDIALFPDQTGTMYSGSALLDTENISGLGDGQTPPLLLYYTAAGETPDQYTQCLAYSKDMGETIQKYAKNPLIPNIAGHNRDPKVIFCEEMGCFIMALYLDGDTRDFALLRSDDLLTWAQFQTIFLPGDGECPDIYPLTDEEGRRWWVFSGAADKHLLGQFVNGLFVPRFDAEDLSFGENRAYAAQTFSGTGDRRIRLSWNRAEIPGQPFNGQMTFPVEMKLKTKNGRPVLTAAPLAEIQTLYTDQIPAAYHALLTAECQENAALLVCGEKISLPFAGKTELSVIIDAIGCEVFVNGGEKYGVFGFVTDWEKPLLALENAALIRKEVHGLRSIWPMQP